MTSSKTPYLCLTVSQASLLPLPTSPEERDFGTFTSLLAHRAHHQSSQLAAGFPGLKGQACLSFTYGQLSALSAKIATKFSTFLKGKGKSDGRQPVIAILGPSGPDFLLNVLACWRLGAAILPIALGTPAKGIRKLLDECGCNAILYSSSQQDLAKQVNSRGELLESEWFDWRHMENDEETFETLHQAGPSDTLVIFHSSGSSGTPKPLPQCHSSWSTSLMNAPGTQFAAFTTTPLFHGGLSDLFRAFQASAPIYFFPWHLSAAPTTETIIQSVNGCDQIIHYFLSVPFILEMLFNSKEGLELLKRMDVVSTGGAPLTETVGDKAVKEHGVKLVSRLGSSECGFLMSSFRDFDNDKEWSWLRISDQLGHSLLQFEPGTEGQSDIFELVVSSQWPTKQLSNRSDGSFATGDLYERHPQFSNRWRYKRRADDSIVMLNGKKTSSSLIEGSLCTFAPIQEAIVFGANRPLLGAILFPVEDVDVVDTIALRKELKPFLVSVNRTLPSHARIPLEMIHFGNSSLRQSLPRSSKGTLQRGMALEKLQELVDSLYTQFQNGNAPSTEEKQSLSGQELKLWLQDLIGEIGEKDIGFDDDFYKSGIDSIMAARIRAGIHQNIDLGSFQLKSNDIYEHPTVALLAQFIDSRGERKDRKREHAMEDMVKRYSKFSLPRAKDDSSNQSGSTTVLLTGATGALGCRILFELLEGDYKVDKVVCLVRAKDSLAGRDRIKKALEERKLKVPDKKIDCITNLWELGMKKDVIGAAKFSIIHAAWIVNFNLTVESFEEDCISGLKDLLDLFLSCSNASRFVFCSSLASIMAGTSPHVEDASHSSTDSGQTGYGNSKWVAEKICQEAGQRVVVARIGQLCGDTKRGIWNTSEAWPLMIRTAQDIGVLPDSGPDIDWLPVDVAAKGIIEVCLASKTLHRYFHVALPPNVKRPSWSSFLDWLRQGGFQFDTASKSDWLKAVQEKGDQIRGSALFDIWASIPDSSTEHDLVDMKHAIESSKTLANAKAVDQELCSKMVEAWKETGFLS